MIERILSRFNRSFFKYLSFVDWRWCGNWRFNGRLCMARMKDKLLNSPPDVPFVLPR